ncbi:MAG: rRNA maturation RNase YbeY [Saprospiraceae bacterium]
MPSKQGSLQFFAEPPTKHPFKKEQESIASWLKDVVSSEHKTIEQITYIFCNDQYLLDLNQSYLQHDTLTDIITFPYKEGDILESDIFISIERVQENAQLYQVSFQHELSRVMVHGILHLIGYKDKTPSDKNVMRAKEEYYISKLQDQTNFLIS